LLYNICYGAGVGHRLHLPFPYAGHLNRSGKTLTHIIDFIQSATPDIAGLIEVDGGSVCADRSSQAEAIAEALGGDAVFESKYADSSMANKMPVFKNQGNAMLVRNGLTFCGKRFHYLNHGMKRLVIEVELPEVVIFLVHLALKFRIRQHQLTELYHLVKGVHKPVIVAGDFNSFWGERELELFLVATNLTIAGGPSGLSYPSRSPRMQLDVICHSPEIRTQDFQIPQIRLSDHAPILWDFIVGCGDSTIASSPNHEMEAAHAGNRLH